jgi:hypothetical protein
MIAPRLSKLGSLELLRDIEEPDKFLAHVIFRDMSLSVYPDILSACSLTELFSSNIQLKNYSKAS